MFTRYRTVLAHSGAWRFSLTAFVARLPISISTLGIVLLVTGLGKSYGLAGALSASFTIANGLSSVVQGRLLDRLGQARGAPGRHRGVRRRRGRPGHRRSRRADPCGCRSPRPSWPVRRTRRSARWCGRGGPTCSPDGPTDVQTAYALESVIDEVIFVIGPTVATVLATQWHPWAGLGLALVTGVPGTLALAAQRRTQPVPHARAAVVRATTRHAVDARRPARRASRSPSVRCSPRPRSARSRSPPSSTPSRSPGSCSPAGPRAAWWPGC